MAHEIVDEPAILADLARAAAIGDARRLHDGGIVAHIVDDAHEAMIEHGDRLVENLLERGDGGAARRLRAGALSVDLGLPDRA